MTLSGWIGRVALLGLVTTGLSGCVAVAAIPAIAGGVAAKKAGDYAATTRARKRASGEQQARVLPTSTVPAPRSGAARITTATVLPPPDSARSPAAQAPLASASAAPLPTDLSTMRPGVAYTGALPSPFATPTASTASPAPTQRARWTDVGRYVASLPGSLGDSALLARGSTSEAPAWVPCTGPRAVLVRLETAMTQDGGRWQFDREAQQWFDAFQTLEIPVVFTSPAPTTARSDIETAFRNAGLAKLLGLGEVRLGLTAGTMPAERAAIAAQRCIVAVVGRDASDFPNGVLPDTSPPALRSKWRAGWFLVDAS